MDAVMGWLAVRTPLAPDELKAWLRFPDEGMDPEGGRASVPGALLKAAMVHLKHAVARPGRDRGAAHELLAADALITYACEAASEAADIEAALLEVLVAVRTGATVE